MLSWLNSYLLWISLSLMLASALLKNGRLSAAGWGLFGLFWLGHIDHYIQIEDYFNVGLFALAGGMCLYMAWIMRARGFSSGAYSWASYAAAACGLIYFPFAEIQTLQNWMIGFTTFITAGALQALSVPVVLEDWNVMAIDGHPVEIVLACTAIESIALFAGVILSVQAPPLRRLKALIASTLSIYILNILRNAFVVMAYGWEWFGEDSFDIAHNVIAKIGSTIAMLVISYLVFLLLPELLSIIDELADEIRPRRGESA